MALGSGTSVVLTSGQVREVSEILRSGVAAPLTSEDIVIGALVAYSSQPAGPALVRAVEEVAAFASGQLDLAELDRTRARSAEAEVRVLRAQISPHFIYNSLTAIASFVRTDPDRARDLLLDFADFTRYSFRAHGRFTTLAEELHSIEQYLLLEQARFGDRLRVVLRVDPEVVGVRIPFLCIQPLVENAVRHGFENSDGPGTITHQGAGPRRRGAGQRGGRRGGDRPGGGPAQPVRRAGGPCRPGQRGRAPAQHVRRRPRPDRGDRSRRRHEGDHADPEVRRGGGGR